MLEVTDLHVNYGPVKAVHGVSFSATAGRVTLVLGANGAGKSTSLRAVAGFHKPASGSVVLEGTDITGTSAHRVVRRGMVLVPEGRKIFFPLTVEENLRIGGYAAPRGNLDQGIAEVYEKFPILGDRCHAQAGLLSGGEQQMLAFGRALMSRPKLMLMDEPSMGLAPTMVEKVMSSVRSMADAGIGILMVEQNAEAGLRVADDVFVVSRGETVWSGSAEEARGNKAIVHAMLGEAALDAS
ncbi:ABC transporter ATP-binding protein [Nocardioides daphniae]|uniref:ABC transporter ATP-binding protein n=1 Tax=Nocardioides daphniae TaxID=402297 RepID=A0A4P7UB32_9ACTN|nr:ABC transporter ATP-binding protein [Nocardioides daphniae]QCC76458.1 ABC transporter ATP-binding protein [Nocardioides daphniae]GGD06575.1 ABC transporter ATP-binding protein [Nocardioides daphniae]